MATIYENARIFTSDPGQPWAEALVTDGERIAFVGALDEARQRAGTDAEVVDLAGNVVMPGFVDAHAHVVMTGSALDKAQLRSAEDLDEILRRLAIWADEHPDSKRILGTSWLFSQVADGLPTAAMLDTAFPDRPVYLESNDLHTAWVNTRALEELGITDSTPDPIGGRIERDPITGAATGLLHETVVLGMIMPLLAQVDDATRDGWLAAAINAYHQSGTTAAVDMALEEANLACIERAELAGRLPLRLFGHWVVFRTDNPDEELAQVERAAQLCRQYRSDRFRMVGIKLLVDGVIDACTSAMKNPYADGSNADPIWDEESLTRVVTAADAAGIQVAMHAIGDLAVHIALNALESAAATNGTSGRRHRIEHLEYADPADIPRLGQLGVTASMQPVHVNPAYLPNWAAMLGHERANEGFAWPEYVNSGATLAFGTDSPTAPHHELPNMYIAATRASPDQPEVAPHRPDWALPLDESVMHGTRDAAWASFAEDSIGTLRAGLYADFIVIDADPFTDGAPTLLTSTVVRTVFAGLTVHHVD